MSRLHGLSADGSGGDQEGSGIAVGKRTLTQGLPAVQRSPLEPEPTVEDLEEEDHDEDEEEDEDDELDDPFGLHLPKPVQMKAEADADGTSTKKKKKKKKKSKKKKKGTYDSDSDGKDALGNLTENTRGDRRSGDKTSVFAAELEVMKTAKVFNHKAKKVKGRTIAAGTRVRVHKVGIKQVHISTADGSVAESDNLWLKAKDLGGTGRDVRLGNADDEDQARAAQIQSSLPPGRNPGQSKAKWKFRSNFYPSIGEVALSGSLMSKIHQLIEWAIYNDMVTGDIEFSWGVRSPTDAHKFNVAYEIRHGGVSLEELQALPDGKDKFGNVWYRPGDTLESVKAWIEERGLGNNPAASGFPRGHKNRAPALRGKMGISDHCSGHAVDVHIPWRARDGEGKDVWAWEEIYHQFGLTRPLHRDRGPSKKPEEWHIEETGKELDATDGADIDMGVLGDLLD